MTHSPEYIKQLLERYTSGVATEIERNELMEWIDGQPEDNPLLEEYFRKLKTEYVSGSVQGVNWEVLYQGIAGHTQNKAVAGHPKKVRRIWTSVWFRSAAAAMVIGIISLLIYHWKTGQPTRELSQLNRNEDQNDIAAPHVSKATITLGNGQVIVLDSANKGVLAMQGNVKLSKLDSGVIVYAGNSATAADNTLFNPRGSKVVSLILSDGSRVWLNAASSIRYPAAFSGAQRRVEVTGEVYFEVAPHKYKPFIVTSASTQVHVLGTHFNVQAYEDEASMKITLLTGAVRVVGSAQAVVLQPGQQAVVSKTIETRPAVNLDEVMAWKNGRFNFEGLTLSEVMHQLEKWYDIQVIYEKNIPAIAFYGELDRNMTLATLLETLKDVGLHVKLNGRQLIVQAQN